MSGAGDTPEDRPGAAARLQKYIAACGHCSRRHAELLIEAGLVHVNGKVVDRLGVRVVPGRDVVTINGDPIVPPTPYTLALHKPVGFITAEHDTHERLTVMDLLPRRHREAGVSAVGRLDLQTSGLLLLTNDGDLAHRISHPRYGCRKVYEALVQGEIAPPALRRLSRGVRLEDGMARPAEVSLVGLAGEGSRLRLVLQEGRKRQVRRMCEAVGHPVVTLVRIQVGPISLGSLQPGQVRELDEGEVGSLRASCDQGS